MTAKTDSNKDVRADLKEGPIADLSGAPLPTKQTLRAKRSVPLQLLKFVDFDLRIMRMVMKGHSQ